MKYLAYSAAFVGALALATVGTVSPAAAEAPMTPVSNPPSGQAVIPPALAANPVCPPAARQTVATHHYRARVHHSQYSSVRSYSYVREVAVPVPTPVYYQPPPPPPPAPVFYAAAPDPAPWGYFHRGWRGGWGHRWW